MPKVLIDDNDMSNSDGFADNYEDDLAINEKNKFMKVESIFYQVNTKCKPIRK